MLKYYCIVQLVMCILFVNIAHCRTVQQYNEAASDYQWNHKTEAQRYYEQVPTYSKYFQL